MAAVPAEASRPTRRFRGGDEGIFLAVAVVVLFLLGLVMLSKGVLAAADSFGRTGPSGSDEWLAIVVVGVAGGVLVFAPICMLSFRTRSRSSISDYMFRTMKVIMFLAGIVFLIGGVFDLLGPDSPEGEVAQSSLTIVYLVTPVCLHIIRR